MFLALTAICLSFVSQAQASQGTSNGKHHHHCHHHHHHQQKV